MSQTQPRTQSLEILGALFWLVDLCFCLAALSNACLLQRKMEFSHSFVGDFFNLETDREDDMANAATFQRDYPKNLLSSENNCPLQGI